ncbi:MAG: fumarylacetoacetate hydrolase family protein [Chitinophagaceae bacterium]
MKLASFLNNNQEHLAIVVNERLYPLSYLNKYLPVTMQELLADWSRYLYIIKLEEQNVRSGLCNHVQNFGIDQVQLLSPVPKPTSCRDGYAFRQHVETARRNRNLQMIPEFDKFPVFYFTNHQSIQGPGHVNCMPDHFEKLDFELEVAVVICKGGRNIQARYADQFIGGLMIMNDLSARRLQMEEMLLNLGPAKGKDFATAVGPWLVTLDELAPYEEFARGGHEGKHWNLKMTCKVNGTQVSEGNVKDMEWTFGEIIERASYGVDLYPGDIIGSGTVGTGCFMELNGTGKINMIGYQEQWLQDGDVIEMEIDGLGKLTNSIAAEKTDWSVLKQKKLNTITAENMR